MAARSADTKKLMRMLSGTYDIDDFLEKYKKDMINPDFTARLKKLLEEKGLTITRVTQQSGISQSYCYQVFKGIRMPSRDKIIQLGIGLNLNLAELNELLTLGGKAKLYIKYMRDAIVIYAINNSLSLQELEDLLYENDLKLFTKN